MMSREPAEFVADETNDIRVTLAEKSPDERSNERVIELCINNRSKVAVSIDRLTLYTQLGVKSRGAREAPVLTLENDYRDTLEKSEVLVRDLFFFAGQADIKSREAQIIEIVKGAIGGDYKTLRGMVLLMLRMFLQPYFLSVVRQRFRERYLAITVDIRSSADVRRAVKQLEEVDAKVDPALRYHLSRLEQIERERDETDEGRAIRTIPSGSSYSEHYVLVFPRHFVSARSYNVAIDVRLKIGDGRNRQLRSSSIGVLVPGRTWTLSAVAVIFSILGVLSREVLAGSSWPGVFPSELMVSSTLAFIVFNTFELFGIETAGRLRVSWQTAMLLGFLCGVMNENFLEALTAFVRISPGE